MFVTRSRETQGAESAVDPQGGLHFAYTALVPLRDNPQAYYSSCTAQPITGCTDHTRWRTVALGTQVNEVQLALTPAGKPRLMIRQSNITSGELSDTYVYAECNSGCTSAAGWQLAAVAESTDADPKEYDQPQRSFALDPQGRPRLFFYGGRSGGSTRGSFYASCDTNCASNPPANPSWTVSQVMPEGSVVDYPVLTFTKAGQPRVLAVTYSGGNTLTYMACDGSCHAEASWRQADILDRGSGFAPVWDLKLDSNDRPRIVHVRGELTDSPEQLMYGWCDTNCLAGPESWRVTIFGLGATGDELGHEPSLVLDAQNRPRIAVRTSFDEGGLNLIWCNTGCNGPNGQWEERLIESNADLARDTSVTTPLNCTSLGWRGGLRPEIALDARGNPRIASDAEWTFRCLYRDPNDPNGPPVSRIESSTFTRFTLVEQPE